jgi:hypothetical protein
MCTPLGLPIEPVFTIVLFPGGTSFHTNSIAINSKPGNWLSSALNDAGILYATICSVAMHMQMHLGTDTSVDIPYYKDEAFAVINKRLADPRQQTADNTIGTVATLASFEVSLP